MTNLKTAKIIAITGRARTGKDTTAELILSLLGGYRYSFADPIRAMLRAIGIDMDNPEWQSVKETPIPGLEKSPRFLMQTLGTEWGREIINKDIWVIMAQMALGHNGPGMIISDLRFENEARWVRNNEGVIIHLNRAAAPEVEAHSSEAGIVSVAGDIVIDNNGSLEDLRDQLLERLK